METLKTAILIPGRSQLTDFESSSKRSKAVKALKALQEEVIVINMFAPNGNAKVQDKNKKIFYCNQGDLVGYEDVND